MREDVNAALEYIGSRTLDDMDFEVRQGYTIDPTARISKACRDLTGLNLVHERFHWKDHPFTATLKQMM